MFFLSLIVGSVATDKYIYCEEYWQTSNCQYACSTSNMYTTCGSGSDYSKWCRCGSCEKAWSSAQSACYALYIANNFQWCHEIDEDTCCDYADPTSCQSTSLSSSGTTALTADSPRWGPEEWTGVSEEPVAQSSNTMVPALFVLLGLALLGFFGAGTFYLMKRKKVNEDLANLNAISGPNYGSPADTTDKNANQEVTTN